MPMTAAQGNANDKQANDESHVSPIDWNAKPKKITSEKGDGLWLLSFGDLSLILISFFILLLSYSTVSQKKADVMREAVTAKDDKATPKPNSLSSVSKRIEAEIKRLKLDKNAQVTFDDAGVAIEFKDGLLFSQGSAASNPKFKEVVGQVMRVIALTPDKFQLKIEGHTDDVPINSTQFASNWELAASRSIALMRQFSNQGVAEERMSIVSYAHTKPKRPTTGLVGNDLAQARAANRRVVIRIEPK
jgi:chemotaxis protein MotB